jgi:serine phosphatase RsbU (regulator of sigma subunit)
MQGHEPVDVTDQIYELALHRARLFSAIVIAVDLLLFVLYDLQNYTAGRWAESTFFYYGVIWRAVTVTGFVFHLAADAVLRTDAGRVSTAQRILMRWYIAWVVAMGTSQALLQQLVVPDVSIYALCVLTVATLLHLPDRWSWLVYFGSLGILIAGIRVMGADDIAWAGLSTNASSVVVVALVLEHISRGSQVRRFRDEHIIARKSERVEAAYALMAGELREARQVQLALLPREAPALSQAEVAALSRPAAQVGGDYYDWTTHQDGTLTLVIGDATGHGARAGAMVTATKALLTGLMETEYLPDMLREASSSLRRLRLPRLFMALAAARLQGNRLTLAGAGMPPALIHRADTGCVEIVSLRGAPLGAPPGYDYVSTEVMLMPGDTVVLMTDGVVEQRDHNGVDLGDGAVSRLVRELAGIPAADLVEALMARVMEWSGEEPSHDDITVVILRMHP